MGPLNCDFKCKSEWVTVGPAELSEVCVIHARFVLYKVSETELMLWQIGATATRAL